MRPAKPASLVEGIDYYLEGTRVVLTAAYHLRRGTCCNSKCRHCPYREGEGAPARLEIVVPKLPSGG